MYMYMDSMILHPVIFVFQSNSWWRFLGIGSAAAAIAVVTLAVVYRYYQ